MTDLQPQLGTCPTCESTDPKICMGTGPQNRPHPHGKHGLDCCADIFHLGYDTAAPMQPLADKTPAYVEGEPDQQTWPCTGCGKSHKLNEACFGARVSVGAQPGPEERVATGPVSAMDVMAYKQAQAERHAAEDAYTISAFDYERDPVGSRDWELFWKGWQARSRTGSSLNWERDCPKCGDCPKPCLCSCHVGTANDPRKAAPPSSPGAPQTCPTCRSQERSKRNMPSNAAFPQYWKWDGDDYCCVDPWHELSSPGADTEQKNG